MTSLTNSELIVEISNKTGISNDVTRTIVEQLVETITEKIKDGEEVQLWKFGKFERRTYKPRKCYNPIKDKIEMLEGSYAPAFKPGVKLRGEINK